MRMSWQTDAGHIVCRWSEMWERVQNKPGWMHDFSRDIHRDRLAPVVPAFTRFSPFGSPACVLEVIDKRYRHGFSALP